MRAKPLSAVLAATVVAMLGACEAQDEGEAPPPAAEATTTAPAAAPTSATTSTAG